ncbi:MAG: hypothetical protein KAH21_11260, partial [Spirochaetaceae bacterium]|nr:hypothetical protein [Spirochaetaceae bacterium]
HINLGTVDRFIDSSDFFTLDVADGIGGSVDEADIETFLKKHADLMGSPLDISGLSEPLLIDTERAKAVARNYLPAVRDAGKIYRHILDSKGEGNFIAEVSMDETDTPQGPSELLLILAAIADEGIPVQTIAPRFSGRFNKGVEYVGDPKIFAPEFEADLMVIRYAAEAFGVPENLKLSVHSGSDKFAIYPEIGRLLQKHGAGLHLKTAGTTWLEEIIGLAEAGGAGLDLAKTVYSEAYLQKEALCAPYAEVINIDYAKLPEPMAVTEWSSEEYVRALRHDASDELYNIDLRQLIHVGYKVAAQMGSRYLDALAEHRESVARNVTYNLYERHMKPL